MDYQPLEKLLPRAGNSVYTLVRMASNRALELADGKRCLIEKPESDKVTSRALEEIAKGMVECSEIADKNRPVYEEVTEESTDDESEETEE